MAEEKRKGNKDEKGLRVAILDENKCKPKKCAQECKKGCPVVRMGKLCIEVTPTSKSAVIAESLCIGCNICVKKCPFQAIQIINLPKNLESETTHRYGQNTFKLHRLPQPKMGAVLGLVGTNGIGKSTALKILAGKLKPNLGKFTKPPEWTDILRYFRGNELQNYFAKILEDKLRAVIKPQYVDHIPRVVKGTVIDIMKDKDELNKRDELIEELELGKILKRQSTELSGGELQRFAIAIIATQKQDVYMYDEPSSYLDVKQRLKAAQVIRNTVSDNTYVITVEHDLSVLDYLSDQVCVLYGAPGAYGVVTTPYGVREGINIFLDGFIPGENLRFRDDSLTFKISDTAEEEGTELKNRSHYQYPDMNKTLGTFKLQVEAGDFSNSEITVLLGQNGTGKTTFIRMLANLLPPDEGKQNIPEMKISYKPQTISPKFTGTVKELLQKKIMATMGHPQFQTDVYKPLKIEELSDYFVQNLSGGELQRVAIVLALGQPADVYLLDEPSAYLDSEQRVIASKVIKRYVMHAKKTAFIVEHDFIMATYLADRVIVYEGSPGQKCKANTPQTLVSGLNKFLKELQITFRRDPDNYRPRINKIGSQKDQEQKKDGKYFFIED